MQGVMCPQGPRGKKDVQEVLSDNPRCDTGRQRISHRLLYPLSETRASWRTLAGSKRNHRVSPEVRLVADHLAPRGTYGSTNRAKRDEQGQQVARHAEETQGAGNGVLGCLGLGAASWRTSISACRGCG